MTKELEPGRGLQPSQQELALIEQFQTVYNAIDRRLRKVLGKEKNASFTFVVKEYARSKPSWAADADYIEKVGDLRNILVHERTESYQYLAIPTLPVVKRLEAILRRLTNPALAIPTFQRKVEIVSISDALADILKRISERDYSQFPVYDEKRFKGLLTENGITRWLAHHVSNDSKAELADILVREVLGEEEKRPNWMFVQRNEPVDEIKALFADRELLEAVLITNSGSRNETLMGIVTRWDIIQRQ